MVKIYVELILKGLRTLGEVPSKIREAVEEELKKDPRYSE